VRSGLSYTNARLFEPQADEKYNEGNPMAEFDADELGKRLERLNREQLAALEQLSDRVLRTLEADRLGPKRADGTAGIEQPEARRSTGHRKQGKAI